MERYTKNPKGAIYGFMQTSTQSGRYRKKFASILPNILNASAWGEIGGGYSGAMYGGEFAAKKALKLLGETK
jgi:prolycopene isomerase